MIRTLWRSWIQLVTRKRSLFAVGVASLPIAILIPLLACYAVNVPFWDQWELVPYLQKMQAGTLQPIDVFDQHNEHRILFPRMIMLALAWLTQWNTLYEVAFSVVVACGTFIFLWLIVRTTFQRPLLRFAAILITGFLLFSPAQFENWLWGWQIQWFLNVFGLVVAVWALAVWKAKPGQRLAVATVAAIIAAFSLASGIFVWAVCLALVLCDKKLRQFVAVWIAAAVFATLIYYAQYIDPSGHPSKVLFLQQPIAFVQYLATYIALPLAPFVKFAVPVAVVYTTSITAVVVMAWRRYGRIFIGSILPWLCIGMYGVCAAASTGVSRLGFGVGQAYSSRYFTLAVLIVIASVVVALKIVELSKGPTLLKRASLYVVAFLVIASSLTYGKGILQMQNRHTELLRSQECARSAQSSQDACLLLLYPNQEIVWSRLQYLRQIHFGGL